MMTSGKDVLDALIAGVNIVELDPLDTSVGYGGLPNADGVVQLDSCCMHGPKKRAGGVACARGRPHAVARGAEGDGRHRPSPDRRQGRADVRAQPRLQDRGRPQHRALARGVARVEAAHRSASHYLDPVKREAALRQVDRDMMAEGLGRSRITSTARSTATASTPQGEICGVTTTSGLAWKIPGRVGDSPILGAGLYVDGEVGAAGSTGRGEANLYNLSSFLIVEEMRRGTSPKDAGMEALQADQGEHGREAAAERARPAELQRQLLHAQRQGRVRRRHACNVPAPRRPARSRSATSKGAAARDVRAAASGRPGTVRRHGVRQRDRRDTC